MGCNICNAGKVGLKWTRELNIGNKSLRVAALEFNMTIDEVMEHLNSHHMEDTEETIDVMELVKNPAFFYRELWTLIVNLKEWLEVTRETGDLDRNNIELGLKLLREIRETLKLIAELDGKLNKGDTYQIQYNQIQGDFNVLISTVLGEVCDECQGKVLKAMEGATLLPLQRT
jgi:sarcosine oxidase delta subunit